MRHPAYGQLRPVSEIASVLLENNPSTMTLEGTNSWVLRAPGAAGSVVIDPGHDDEEHLDLLVEAAGDVELVLLTHHHPDHADGAPGFAERVGAPVRAAEPELCRGGGDIRAIGHGDVVEAAGLRFDVLHTPGHTGDSVCLTVGHGSTTHVLTGDTILGYGTTVLSNLGDYLDSLDLLSDSHTVPDGAVGLPGHGPELANLRDTVREYREHREQRLNQVRGALAELGAGASPRQIVEFVYTDVDPKLWGAAESSVRAQLDYLNRRG